MCKKAADAFMSTSKFITYWFVAPKMLKNFAYCLFFENLDAGYDYGNSDDGSIGDSDNDSDYIKSLSFFNISLSLINTKNLKIM